MTRKADNSLTGNWGTTPDVAPIGGGGFIIGFDQSVDGTRMLHGADVNQGMIRNSNETKWSWLFRPDNVPLSEREPRPSYFSLGNNDFGCPGVRIAPSNKDIIYACWNGLVWKSLDGAASWAKTTGTFYTLSNSGRQRYSNRLMDVHPTNPSTVLLGTNHYATDVSKSGLFFTTDAGATWTKVSGLPVALDRDSQPGRNLVSIDPGNPTIAYVHVSGVGLYQCTTFPSATGWTLVSGSPTLCSHLLVMPNGDVFIAAGGSDTTGQATNDVYRRTRAGVATQFSTGAGSGAITIAVNPNTANHWVTAEQDGVFSATYDSGATWERFATFGGNFQRGPGEIAWISNKTVSNSRVFPGMIQFDRATANKLWITHGIGIASSNVPTSAGGVMVLNDYTNGNEEKVAESFLSVPGDPRPILGVWDYSIWPMDSLTEWKNNGIIPPLANGNGLAICKRLDYAADDPNFRVAAIAQAGYSNAQSTDKGNTWTSIPNQANTWGWGGDIACNLKSQIVILETNNGKGRWTADGGATWGTIKLDGTNDTTNFINSFSTPRKALSADKAVPGTFALLVSDIVNNAYGNPLSGLWVTKNSGQTWTRKITGAIGSALPGFTGDNRQFWGCELQYVPGFAGEMVYTPHNDDATYNIANGNPDRLFWLTGDGNTIAFLGANVRNVASFSFGPPAPGATRPSVAFYGQVNGVTGLYLSIDWFATDPILVSRFPMLNLSGVGPVGADRNKFGRIFIGGIGWNYFTYGKRLKVKGA